MSDTWSSPSPQQRVIEKQLARLKTVIGTEGTVGWFSGEAYSRGLIDSHVHKVSSEIGHSAVAKAGELWDAILNRMKTGDSKNTFQSILDIFEQELSTRYVVEQLNVALSLEIHSKPASIRSNGAMTNSVPDKYDLNASTRSFYQDPEALPKNTVDNSQAFQHDENGTGSKSSIQEEQSSASAQLVTPQEAQVSYDNFDRAIEHIKLAQIVAAEEMRELKSKYNEKCNEVQKLTCELKQSEQEKQDLCKKICQLETEAKVYKRKVDHLETQVGDLKSRVKTLEESIKDKEVEKERLLKEKAMMETELVKKDLELSRSELEKERLKRELAENQSRIAVFQAGEEVEKIRKQSFSEIQSLQRQFSQQSLSKDEEVKTKDLEIQSLREELQVLKSQSH